MVSSVAAAALGGLQLGAEQGGHRWSSHVHHAHTATLHYRAGEGLNSRRKADVKRVGKGEGNEGKGCAGIDGSLLGPVVPP